MYNFSKKQEKKLNQQLFHDDQNLLLVVYALD